MYTALNKVKGGRFTIAAAFGNVHGVYSPGNVQLTPDILHNCQKYIKEKDGGEAAKPATFVFHGGSGSSREDIRYAIEAGTVKMNIDTDTQCAPAAVMDSEGHTVLIRLRIPLRPHSWNRAELPASHALVSSQSASATTTDRCCSTCLATPCLSPLSQPPWQVGLLGRPPLVRGRVPPIPAGPDRQPRR